MTGAIGKIICEAMGMTRFNFYKPITEQRENSKSNGWKKRITDENDHC